MANLAIKGHSTRGKEVIEILEMLGGKISNECGYEDGFDFRYVYFIDTKENFFIDGFLPGNKHLTDFSIFTLEKFLEKFPYKIGDKVLYEYDSATYFIKKMFWENDKILYELSDEVYSDGCSIPDTLIFDVDVVKLQPYKEQETIEDNSILNQLSELDSKTFADGYNQGYDDGQHDMTEWNLPNGFIFKDENGNVINANKIVLEKKKPEYPKTYKECCKILELSWNEHFGFIKANDCFTDEENKLIESFIKLKRCRDAYWKIAGEEMGLGKPWKPDFSTIEGGGVVYGLHNLKNEIVKIDSVTSVNLIIAFPKAKIRSIFYENFKDLIEQCKELL